MRRVSRPSKARLSYRLYLNECRSLRLELDLAKEKDNEYGIQICEMNFITYM